MDRATNTMPAPYEAWDKEKKLAYHLTICLRCAEELGGLTEIGHLRRVIREQSRAALRLLGIEED